MMNNLSKKMYEYRWHFNIIIMILIFMIAYFYDLDDPLNEIETLSQNEMALKNKIKFNHTLQHKPSLSDVPLKESNIIDELYQTLLSIHWEIKTITIHPLTNGIRRITLKANGEFKHLLMFMLALKARAMPVALEDFSYHVAKDGRLNLSMNIALLEMAPIQTIQPIIEIKTKLNNPFCFNSVISKSSDRNQLQLFTLQQLKLVGMMEQNANREVLVYLPNGETIAVKIGSIIGKEHARIVYANHQIKFVKK